MREIRFRAWDGERLRKVNTIGWVDDGVDFVTTPRYSGPAEDFRLMQYTGLKDKNGVEIYEGDIVRFTNSIDEIYNEVGKVTWEQSECNFVAKYKTANGTTITIYLISNETYRECVQYEVIGNIYENPELLEREPQ